MEPVMMRDYGIVWDLGRLETRRTTAFVVLHHTGNDEDDDWSAAEIDAVHRMMGWAGIGYHYVIRKDGAVELGRPAWAVGAHAEGSNRVSLGIQLSGNFCLGEPTPPQIESCAMLLALLSKVYGFPPDGEHILGHRDLNDTGCPGDALYALLPELIGKACWYREQ